MQLVSQYQISCDDLKSNRHHFKRIFFYRICGTGMGAAACLLKESGLHIEGGDIVFYPPMSEYLRSTGILCHELNQVSIAYLKTFDLIVVGNVVPGTGMHAEILKELQVPFTSFPAVLGAFLLEERQVIGIAGTHGKTTTTYLMAQIFENLGENPGFLIGGVLGDRPASHLGQGRYFFIESDEYDSSYFHKISKFHFYSINDLVLTSLEYDHADIFSSLGDIEVEFQKLLPTVDHSMILCTDYPAVQRLYNEVVVPGDYGAKVQFYGLNSITGPLNIKTGEQGSHFTLQIAGKQENFQTNLIGFHNLANLTPGILFAYQEGHSLEKIRKCITNLKMVKRRQEVRGLYRQSIVIDDFAHHPRAVTETIRAISARYPGKRILTVLSPESATARSSVFQEEFVDSLCLSDDVIIVKPARESNIPHAKGLDVLQMVDKLKTKYDKWAKEAKTLEELRALIDDWIFCHEKQDRLLLFLGNGTCLGLWSSDFVGQITRN